MKVIFVSATKMGESTTKHFKTDVFPNEFTLCQIKQISTYRKLKFASVLTSRNVKRLKLTKAYHSFSYFV